MSSYVLLEGQSRSTSGYLNRRYEREARPHGVSVLASINSMVRHVCRVTRFGGHSECMPVTWHTRRTYDGSRAHFVNCWTTRTLITDMAIRGWMLSAKTRSAIQGSELQLFQESGRAARDSKPARSLIYYSADDASLARYIQRRPRPLNVGWADVSGIERYEELLGAYFP